MGDQKYSPNNSTPTNLFRRLLSWLVVEFGFKYLTPFVFLLTPSNLASLSVEGCKKITERRKEGNEDTFQLKLYFWILGPFNGRGNSSWNQWKWSRLQDQLLKYAKSHFRRFYDVEVCGNVRYMSSIEAAAKMKCNLSPSPKLGWTRALSVRSWMKKSLFSPTVKEKLKEKLGRTRALSVRSWMKKSLFSPTVKEKLKEKLGRTRALSVRSWMKKSLFSPTVKEKLRTSFSLGASKSVFQAGAAPTSARGFVTGI